MFREGNFRGFFFSREEAGMHVHVSSPDGEAKFRIDPLEQPVSVSPSTTNPHRPTGA